MGIKETFAEKLGRYTLPIFQKAGNMSYDQAYRVNERYIKFLKIVFPIITIFVLVWFFNSYLPGKGISTEHIVVTLLVLILYSTRNR